MNIDPPRKVRRGRIPRPALETSALPGHEPVYRQALERVDNLAELRRLRIFAGINTVPSVIWLVLLFGGLITVAYTYSFAMPHIGLQYNMTALLALTVAFILFLIYVLDHPFTGVNRISAEPLRQALAIMKSRR